MTDAAEQLKAKMKSEHGDSVIYEDRGIIDMPSVAVDKQPCGAVNYLFVLDCPRVGVYRVHGSYRDRRKGARSRGFGRHLCAEHLAAWATLHGTTVEALLKGPVDDVPNA